MDGVTLHRRKSIGFRLSAQTSLIRLTDLLDVRGFSSASRSEINEVTR